MGAQHQQQASQCLQQEISQKLGMLAGLQTVEYQTGKSRRDETATWMGAQHQQQAISQKRPVCQERQLSPASDTDN